MRGVFLAAGLAAAGPAWACGQSTHVWIGLHARDHLPAGPLRDLLTDEALRDVVINGAMFPDGGYSPIVRDGYGEIAHWEPFQSDLAAVIRERHGAALAGDEARALAAFLFGLAAHGMADQVYDGVYLTRSQVYEPEAWAVGSVDTASDVAMVASVGAQPLVDPEAPWETLQEVFAAGGHEVSVDTMVAGQTSLKLAVAWVGQTGEDPATAAEHVEAFPWANGHLLDTSVPGAPVCIGKAVAAYWQKVWGRLQGDYELDRDLIVYGWPEDGGVGHPLDSSSIESTVSLVLSTAIRSASLEGRVVVTDSAGAEHPVTADLYYGDRTNVLNVWPEADWVDGETYTVTLKAGLETEDGQVVGADQAVMFTAGAVVDEEACGCAQGPRGAGGAAALWLLWARRRRR